MADPAGDPQILLQRALESGRVHSAYLLSGPGERPRQAAIRFARALVCLAEGHQADRPCEACVECRRSAEREPVVLDGTGKRGPLFRHLGDHPDLRWVERGAADTRVRIGQIRAIQHAMRLGAHQGGWRAAVIADAEWLNQEAQNALLRLLEEPPDRTCLLLVSTSATALLPTIRSRCQRVVFRPERRESLRGQDVPEEKHQLVERLDAIHSAGIPELLDWAEQYRGERAAAAQGVHLLLETGSDWLCERVSTAVRSGRAAPRDELDAFKALSHCRKDLDQRNANPQMVAERALLAIRTAAAPRPGGAQP
jgi:DNA polymerase III delta prime subunit